MPVPGQARAQGRPLPQDQRHRRDDLHPVQGPDDGDGGVRGDAGVHDVLLGKGVERMGCLMCRISKLSNTDCFCFSAKPRKTDIYNETYVTNMTLSSISWLNMNCDLLCYESYDSL